MQLARPLFAMDPKHFGKAPVRDRSFPLRGAATLGDDITLFATTFVAGFLFVSILIG
jgi:hypothetical protein